MKLRILQVSLCFLLSLSVAVAVAEEVTPAQWLQRQTAPTFAAGHTLPALTRFGWVLPLEARVELADRWGYALEFGGYVDFKVAERALNDPKSTEAQILALMEANPGKYKLSCILSRWEPGAEAPPEAFLRDAEGNFLGEKGQKIFSPETPLAVLREAAEQRAGPLRLLRQRVPISIVLNGGEYMLNVAGWIAKWAEKDPVVMEAKGDRSWAEYLTERKALEANVIAEAVREAIPDRDLYIYYTASGGARKYDSWGFRFDEMRTATDVPAGEYYYKHWNSGFLGDGAMLSRALAARGHELKFGYRNTYNWLCSGWIDEKKNAGPTTFVPDKPPDPDRYPADLRLYEGHLKCMYTTGMLGGNAGYYAYPTGGFAKSFPEDQPPYWLQQMVVTARVHARFSHLESYLRKGDLLPGPDQHVLFKDQPAYEMHTGDPNLHVLVRRQPDDPQWLITAWAADGADRSVTVEVPHLGSIRVLCRSIGTIYTATVEDGRPVLTQVDADEPNSPFANQPPAEGLQVWVSADTGVTDNGEGVRAWANRVNPEADPPVVLVPPRQAPVLVEGAINGKPALAFDGKGTAMALIPLPMDVSGEITAFVVWAAPTGQHAANMPGAQRVISLPGGTVPDYKQPYLPAGKDPVPPQISLLTGKMSEKVAGLGLGGDPWGGWAFEGLIAEFLLYNRKLSAGEIARTKAYLQGKYGL